MNSRQPSLSTLRKLSQKKYREREGLYLIEGSAAVRDAIELGRPPLLVLHDVRVLERPQDNDAVLSAREHGIPVREVEDGELAKISGLSTAPPVAGVFEMPENESPAELENGQLVLAFDRVMDPGNLGTLIRAAVFYGVQELWLGEGTVDPYNPKVVRAAMGAHLHARLCRNVTLEQVLAGAVKKGTRVIATEMEGVAGVEPVTPDSAPAVLLLGNEPAGIAPGLVALAGEHVAIPRRGPVDSLNVAMAGTVLLDRLLAR